MNKDGVSSHDNLLVTMAARAGEMDALGYITLPDGVDGEQQLAEFCVKKVQEYESANLDEPFDLFIEKALSSMYPKEHDTSIQHVGDDQLNEWERLSRKAESIKQQYPKGTRIQLAYMEGERDMPTGLQGTVALVDDIGQVHMNWDNGRTLPLNPELDSFQVLSRPEKKRDDPSR